MKPPRLLPSHVREKQVAKKRGRVLPSTWNRNKVVQSKLAKHPARIQVPTYNFDSTWRTIMSLKNTDFPATTQYAYMLYGWTPPPSVDSADKSGPSSSTARVRENARKDKSKKQDRAAPAQGPPHEPPPRVYSADKSGPSSLTARVRENEGKDKSKIQYTAAPAQAPPLKPPPVPKMQKQPIGMHGAVGEVRRAFVPPRADAGGTATLGKCREATLLGNTEHFSRAAANANPLGSKRPRIPTNHTRH